MPRAKHTLLLQAGAGFIDDAFKKKKNATRAQSHAAETGGGRGDGGGTRERRRTRTLLQKTRPLEQCVCGASAISAFLHLYVT